MRANEFITEQVNPDCFNPAFNDTQTFDGLTYRASMDKDHLGKKYFEVKVFDDNFERVGLVKFKPYKNAKGEYWLESLITAIHPDYRGKGIARNIYAYVRMLGNNIKPSNDQTDQGRAMWNSWQQTGDAEHLMKEQCEDVRVWEEALAEAFTNPYNFKWEEGEYGDWDAIAPSLRLEIGFTRDHDYPDRYQVEFWRNHSVGVTGDGDAQRIFATVLEAMKQFVEKVQPDQLHFTASKEVEKGQNPESRAKLYDRMVQRYASAIGYKAHRMDTGMDIQYELHKG